MPAIFNFFNHIFNKLKATLNTTKVLTILCKTRKNVHPSNKALLPSSTAPLIKQNCCVTQRYWYSPRTGSKPAGQRPGAFVGYILQTRRSSGLFQGHLGPFIFKQSPILETSEDTEVSSVWRKLWAKKKKNCDYGRTFPLPQHINHRFFQC